MPDFPTPVYPGVDPEADLDPQLNAVCVAFICISFIAIAFRFIARKVTGINYGWDDWLIILAAVSALIQYTSVVRH
jgi:type II secretory pathway component PulF